MASTQAAEKIRNIAGDPFALYIPEDAISSRTDALGRQIAEDYEDRPLHIIKIALGALPFATGLTQSIQRHNPDIEMTEDIVRLSSYPNGPTSSGIVRELSKLHEPVDGRHVLIVEDIVDSGNALSYFLGRLRYDGEFSSPPASIAIASLTHKPAKYNGRMTVNYPGFTIPDVWVAGHGMDHLERGRAFVDIYRKVTADDIPAPGYEIPPTISPFAAPSLQHPDGN